MQPRNFTEIMKFINKTKISQISRISCRITSQGKRTDDDEKPGKQAVEKRKWVGKNLGEWVQAPTLLQTKFPGCVSGVRVSFDGTVCQVVNVFR